MVIKIKGNKAYKVEKIMRDLFHVSEQTSASEALLKTVRKRLQTYNLTLV
jgi:hypothetical protein